jgi:hypothetical protein
VYENIHRDDLGSYIGGELADKAIDDIGSYGDVTYEGLDLDLGGKFLKFIYNKKVPQFFKELLKGFKMPSTKVGGEIKGYTIGQAEMGYLEQDPAIAPLGGPMLFESREEARDYIDARVGTSVRTLHGSFDWENMTIEPIEPDEPEVWQQIITDEMRDKFKEGISLTMKEGGGLLGRYA